MLKLNSLAESTFTMGADKESKIKVNGTTLSRNDIVSIGRLIACEYVGKNLNARNDSIEKYASRLEGADYATLAAMHRDQKLLFCAATAAKNEGREAPTSVEEVKKNPSYAKNPNFVRALAAIDQDVIDPLFFAVINDVGMGLMQWDSVSFGGTKQVDIRSNDVFRFEDSSWGSRRSTTKNYLYAKTVTLNPKPYVANATIKYYQDVVNGDAGRYYAALMNGMWNKIYAIFVGALNNAASNTNLIPSALTASTYSTQGWLTISEKVAAANGVRRQDLIAFGKASALSQLLPIDGTGGAITGLQYGLGEEWFKQGFLPKAGGVDVVEVAPVIVPGTQNSSISTIDFGNNIFIAAKAGYKPMYGAYMEGTPITLEMSPSETADFTIDINVTAVFDIKPVFGSKVGVIKSVYTAG